MKRFIRKTLPYAVFILMLPFVGFFLPKSDYPYSYMKGVYLKQKALLERESPKIIFAGGSNLAFGLDSARIEKALNLPVVNAALHAGLGLHYIMNDIKTYIRSGDIVVLVPEYEHFWGTLYSGEKILADFIVYDYPDGFSKLTVGQLFFLHKDFLNVSQYTLKNVFKGKKTSRTMRRSTVYDVTAFNSRGDIVAHWTEEGKDIEPYKPLKSDVALNLKAFRGVREFREYVENKGATLVLVPPSFRRQAYKTCERFISEINEHLKRTGTPFFSDTERYSLNDSLYFDTHYHLKKRGVDVRTELLIEDLRRVVK